MAIIMEPSQGQEGGTIFLVFIRPHDKTSRLQPACTMIEYIYDILLGINVCFSHISFFFLFQLRVVSRAHGSGVRREPAQTPRRNSGP